MEPSHTGPAARGPRHHRPSPVMGQPSPEPARRPHDPVADEIRRQATDRLIDMSGAHANAAWELRNSDPLSPNGLAFLYLLPPTPDKPRPVIRAATRLWLAGPEAERLPMMLHELIGLTIGQANTAAGRGEAFDPRADMANRCDLGMLPAARYVGIGVSTLDTYSGTWAEVTRRVSTPLHVPGRCYLYLDDGSRITIDRRGYDELARVDFYGTHAVGGFEAGSPRRRWYQVPMGLELDHEDTQVWELVTILHGVLREVDNRGR